MNENHTHSKALLSLQLLISLNDLYPLEKLLNRRRESRVFSSANFERLSPRLIIALRSLSRDSAPSNWVNLSSRARIKFSFIAAKHFTTKIIYENLFLTAPTRPTIITRLNHHVTGDELGVCDSCCFLSSSSRIRTINHLFFAVSHLFSLIFRCR